MASFWPIKVERYFPILELSSTNFENALNTDTFKNDYTVLIELANNYIVLGNKKDPRLTRVLSELNRVEAIVPQEEKIGFYHKWMRIASDIGDGSLIDKLQRKIEQVKGK